jgi:fucose permease
MHIDAEKSDIPQVTPVLPSTFTTIINIPQTKETSSSTSDNPSLPSYASSETLLPSIYPPKGFSFNVVVASLCICGFVSALDTIVLASILPAIATDLQATTVDAYWCSSAYLFSQSVVQLVFASFAQAFDRRICMLAALAIFTVASVLCATARDVQWLIAGRAV